MTMQWIIPGTTLSASRAEAGRTEEQFQALFLAGGLTLSQVASITGLEPYAIQNWVKRGFLPPPQAKRYSLEQTCRILNLNILKGALSMDQVVRLIGCINGNLADESDDLVDDTLVFFRFVELAAKDGFPSEEALEEALSYAVRDFREPKPGVQETFKEVLRVMLLAWQANCIRNHAQERLEALAAACEHAN